MVPSTARLRKMGPLTWLPQTFLATSLDRRRVGGKSHHPRVGVSAGDDVDHGTFRHSFHAASVECKLRLAFARGLEPALTSG